MTRSSILLLAVASLASAQSLASERPNFVISRATRHSTRAHDEETDS